MSGRDDNNSNGTEGHQPPGTGKQEPSTGKHPREKERLLVGTMTSGAAGVVLRATVETFGPAGEAELHFSVKWPAAALAEAQHGSDLVKSTDSDASNSSGTNGGIDAEGNLHTPASSPSGPGS
jgi:hypothetical protein